MWRWPTFCNGGMLNFACYDVCRTALLCRLTLGSYWSSGPCHPFKWHMRHKLHYRNRIIP